MTKETIINPADLPEREQVGDIYLPDPPAEIDLSDILSKMEVQHVHVR